ncbi:MAG: hypothetical protein HY824_14740 [Acidobacteria bacterium]|nr:hypothetical protein [Acidobacteriota bacterium]
MVNRMIPAAAAIALLLAGAPALAHHSANAQFDTKQDLPLIGVLTKVENINPHSWWYVDVKGPDGKVMQWKLESLSPNGLIRQGLKVKTDVKLGETYEFRIAPAWKDPEGIKLGFMKAITVNGKEYVVVEL